LKVSPTDVQEMLDFRPFTPLRITLATGDVVNVRHREAALVTGLNLSVLDADMHGALRLRFLSIPNIIMIEPIAEPPAGRFEEGN